jgi:hypothetical protein
LGHRALGRWSVEVRNLAEGAGRRQYAFDGVDRSPEAVVDIGRGRLDLCEARARRIEFGGEPRPVLAHDRELGFQVAGIALGLEAVLSRLESAVTQRFEALQRQIDGLAHGWMPFTSTCFYPTKSFTPHLNASTVSTVKRLCTPCAGRCNLCLDLSPC